MDIQDFKLAIINFFTLSISFSNVEQWLKLLLLVISIIYTIQKIILIKKNKSDN